MVSMSRVVDKNVMSVIHNICLLHYDLIAYHQRSMKIIQFYIIKKIYILTIKFLQLSLII